MQIEDEVVALIAEGLRNPYAELESGVGHRRFRDRALRIRCEHDDMLVAAADN